MTVITNKQSVVATVQSAVAAAKTGPQIDDFKDDLLAVADKYKRNEGQADFDHLQNIVTACKLFYLAGYALCFLPWFSFLPSVLMCISISTWFMCVAHHTSHEGYEQGRYVRKTFGIGIVRRVLDWMDWMLPEAWHAEHNMRHHYQLNEPGDPDNVQQNLSWLREANMPLPVKYGIVFILASTWKWAYYAPNTFKLLKMAELKKEQKNVDVAPMTIAGLIYGPRPDWLSLSEFIIRVAGPYVAHNIVLMLPWLYFGYYQVIIHFVLADWLSNLYTFVNIVPNHAGSDMYVYKTMVRPNTSEWFMRQTISSANYECGNNVIDFAQGWLNYQIEHHCFPKMSMLSYQRMQPEVKAICQKYGIPYVQENVFIRLKKTVDIMIGVSSFIDYQGNEFPICKSIVPQ